MAPFYVKDLHDLNCVACRGSRDGLCYCVVRTYILHSSTLKRANYMKEEQAQLSRNPALGCRIMSGIQHSRHPFPLLSRLRMGVPAYEILVGTYLGLPKIKCRNLWILLLP